ncbi:hypothetical protein [Streptomyces sp. NBC_00690]|uniref:hypothetical protein n=1 Tax=Streptomyces sp. NBC_00690 TaxID=2975808 RepID=UPI002E27D039|nr:hypothetical protein [Streptomyces sp. NBC_00690]
MRPAIPVTEQIKHLVNELDETIKAMRQEPEEGQSWSWADEHAAGLNVADAAEALILALPSGIWPSSWFVEPETESQERSVDVDVDADADAETPTVGELHRLLFP